MEKSLDLVCVDVCVFCVYKIIVWHVRLSRVKAAATSTYDIVAILSHKIVSH